MKTTFSLEAVSNLSIGLGGWGRSLRRPQFFTVWVLTSVVPSLPELVLKTTFSLFMLSIFWLTLGCSKKDDSAGIKVVPKKTQQEETHNVSKIENETTKKDRY